MSNLAVDRALKIVGGGPGKLLIGGNWLDARMAKKFAVINPSTESTIVEVADAGVDDAVLVLDAAANATASWAATAPRQRAEILRRAYQLMNEHLDDIAFLISIAVLVTPWNFPAAIATRKIAPALAAGCTCI